MSGGGGGGGSIWGLIKWPLLILAGIWVLWYFSGGPERAAQQGNDKPFMKPLDPIDTGEVYDIGKY